MNDKTCFDSPIKHRIRLVFFVLVGVLAAPWLASAVAPSPASIGVPEAAAQESDAQASSLPDVSHVFEEQKDKVVAIRAEMEAGETPSHPFFGEMPGPQQPQPREGQGSGFIVDEDGYVLTNYHVVAKATAITVLLENGDSYPAEVVGGDKTTDIALLEIEADRKLPAVELGDSSELKVGQWVIAIGNPFGLDYSVTTGIVSAIGRNIGHGPYDDFIQTDASINPGNSGGPLFDIEGKVIGVNTAIVQGGQGIGFAVPIDMVERILPQLRERGYVTRGYIGASIQQLDDDLADSFGVEEDAGVLIGSVEDDGPAEKAGIQPGDIVTRFDGEPTADTQSLLVEVARTEPGSEATVELIREGDEKSVTVEVAERPDEDRAEFEQEKEGEEELSEADLGVMVGEVTPRVAERLGVEPNRGVLVERVRSDSPAARALRPGDVILRAGGQELNSPSDLREALREHDRSEPLRLQVQRDGRGIFVAIRLEE
ncbi:MAG: trypsin-like peptidase domain-containing protein [Persicimonas sp.]